MSNTERAKRYNKILNNIYNKDFPLGTPIVVACEKGRLEDLKVFVAGHDVDGTGVTVKQLLEELGKDSGGTEMNTLMAAARYEQPEVLVQLLDWGVDPSITDSRGYNALHLSAYENNKTTRCTESLLKKMLLESINKKNIYEETPLDLAYYNYNPIKNDKVQLIRQYGGKANYHDRNGEWVGDGNGDLKDNNNVGSLGSSMSKKRKIVSSSSREQPTKITTEQDRCPICQENILSNNCTWNNNGELVDDENQKIIITNCCNTAYHEKCYVQMLKYRNFCAICKRTLIGYRNPIKTLAIKLYNLKF